MSYHRQLAGYLIVYLCRKLLENLLKFVAHVEPVHLFVLHSDTKNVILLERFLDNLLDSVDILIYRNVSLANYEVKLSREPLVPV